MKPGTGGWRAIRIDLVPDLEDPVAGALADLGSAGWEARREGERVSLLAYWPATAPDDLRERLRARLGALAAALGAPAPAVADPILVPEEDWEAAWRAHFRVEHPIPGLAIHPSWIPYSPAPGEIAITIDPKMAFGVGSHATTQLCLALMEGRCAGKRVLDVGTGTGILAIAAARWGAKNVIAVETDPAAVANARESIARNGVAVNVTLLDGDVDRAPGRFDLIVANLLSSELRRALPAIAARLAPDGHLVVSGLLLEEEGAIRELLAAHGLSSDASLRRGEWCALAARSASHTSSDSPS
jgi:ribosomal protein L11 methyltransferase